MVEIRLVNHREYRDELLDLFRASFRYDMPAEWWDWQYFNNPATSDAPEVVVAVDNGQLVGARPFLISELWIRDDKVKAAQGINIMVHPGYRRQGIVPRMARGDDEYLRPRGYALLYAFSRTAKLMPRQLAQGWQVVSPLDALFGIVNPQNVISSKLGNRLLANELGFFYARLFNSKMRKDPFLSHSFHIETFDEFNDELSAVDSLRDQSKVDLVRDEAYLRWRFDQHPEYHHIYVVAKRDTELHGYAVIRTKISDDGLIRGRIVDYSVRNNNIDCFRSIMAGCIRELKRLGCDLIDVWVFANPMFRKELVQHLGFKPHNRFPYSRMTQRSNFGLKALDEQALQKADIYDKDNWRVTFAYLDVG
jgi:GNAT superfamily N-acetyltransferase